MISRSDFNEYNQAVQRLVDEASKSTSDQIRAWMQINPDASVAECREFAKETMDGMCQVFGEAASSLAAEWYDIEAGKSGKKLPVAITETTYDAEQVKKVAHYQAKNLVDGDIEGFLDRCAEYVENSTKQSLNNTILANVKRDKEAGVRFARVPVGAETCTFCMMLAGRGAVYYSRHSAGEQNHFHRRCDCKIVPGFGDENLSQIVEGCDTKTYSNIAEQFQDIDELDIPTSEKAIKKQEVINKVLGIEKPVFDVENATSIEEIKNQMKENKWFFEYELNGTHVESIDDANFDQLDIESVKSIYRSCDRVFSQWPELKGKLNAVTQGTYSDPSVYAFAYTGTGRGGIVATIHFYSNYEGLKKSYARDLRDGYHPVGTNQDGIIIHELGHAIDDYMTNTLKMGGQTPKGGTKYYSAYVQSTILRKFGIKKSDLEKEVSKYAVEKPKYGSSSSEFFAECIAEYLNSENPRRVAMEVGKMIDGYFS